MNAEREKAVQQYVVYQIKLIELLHLTLLSIHLSDTGLCPPNEMKHGVSQFKETLLGAIAIAFMSISDAPTSTNIRAIWKQLHPHHSKAIDRVWDRKIKTGEGLMKAYRNKAGAHGDRPDKYFASKLGLFRDHKQVLKALDSFLSLSICLLNRRSKEIPEFGSEIEGVLLNLELSCTELTFNRRWLRKMHLVESGNHRKTFS